MGEFVSAQIQDWISDHIGTSEFSVVQLAGDASARRYHRIIQDEKTWVLMLCYGNPLNRTTILF